MGHTNTKGGSEKMKKAIGYLRLSTKEQDEKFGLEAQKQAISEYATANDYEIVEWVKDVVSGVKENRAGLDRILFDTKIANPPFEAVIVYKSDRIARKIEMFFYYEWLLMKKNVNLVSVNDGFPDVPNEYKGIIKSFILFSAEQERHNIALRTSGGRAIKAKCGGYAGGHPPFGYAVENGQLKIDEREAYVVREIFNYRSEGLAYAHIANALNERELFTKTGNLWTGAQVFYILKNENTYRGFYKYGKTNEWVQGQHEAILK